MLLLDLMLPIKYIDEYLHKSGPSNNIVIYNLEHFYSSLYNSRKAIYRAVDTHPDNRMECLKKIAFCAHLVHIVVCCVHAY